ncbi:MAG: FAD-dependent oxidoreductase, partial [Thermoleophilia bacterium]|nr:FAD-dependent oxidoreductase [Thermoleophilia bacterium]
MSDSVLIVGGGIAGITAALNAADYGRHVYLIDDTPSIGGVMARLDKTFPTNDCSICIEAPKMYEVNTHPNIEILTLTEVRKVTPFDGGFQVRLIKKAKFVDEEKCNGCGKCVEACPVSVPDEIDGKIGGTRKLISIPFPQSVPNVNYLD